jgi:hypothetical protein
VPEKTLFSALILPTAHFEIILNKDVPITESNETVLYAILTL